MSEQMREVTKGLDVTGIEQAYPKARKVTVDEANQTAYVFVGRSNRAVTVTGAEFDALVKMLPPATAGDDAAQGAASPDPAAPAAKRAKKAAE